MYNERGNSYGLYSKIGKGMFFESANFLAISTPLPPLLLGNFCPLFNGSQHGASFYKLEYSLKQKRILKSLTRKRDKFKTPWIALSLHLRVSKEENKTYLVDGTKTRTREAYLSGSEQLFWRVRGWSKGYMTCDVRSCHVRLRVDVVLTLWFFFLGLIMAYFS